MDVFCNELAGLTVVHEIGEVVFQSRKAAGFQHHDRYPLPRVFFQALHDPLSIHLGLFKKARRNQRTPAASDIREGHFKTQRFEYFNSVPAYLRFVVVHKGIHEKRDPSLCSV